jgi:UDP-N-acetylglucosamine 3-dehydrogenase
MTISAAQPDQLKAAVIGVGDMGQHHPRVYDQLPSTALVGVADANVEAAERIAGLYHTVAYADYREMLEEARPDVVSVAVPTELHARVAQEAMEAGCHVLVEKPIAATEAEAEELVRQSEILGRKLMVGHIVRFDPAVQELRRLLQAEELGRIFQIRCRRLGPFPARIRDVGVVVDLATHDLDLMRYITGEEVIRLYAETEQEIHSAYEDILVGSVRLTNGTIGVLDVNWLTPTKVRELTVTGERGMYLVDHLTQDLFFFENAEASGDRWSTISHLRGVSEGKMIRFPVQKYEPLRAELESFVGAVMNDTPVPVDGKDGLMALRLARGLVRSGQERRAIDCERGQEAS